MTAFPQIVSRIGHENAEVLELLFRLIIRVMEEYPHQALWMFMSVVKSNKPERERRGRQVLEKIKVMMPKPIAIPAENSIRPLPVDLALLLLNLRINVFQ